MTPRDKLVEALEATLPLNMAAAEKIADALIELVRDEIEEKVNPHSPSGDY